MICHVNYICFSVCQINPAKKKFLFSVLLLQFIYLATQRQKIFPGFTQKLLGAPITLPSKNFQVIRGKSGVSDWIFFSLFVEKLSLLGYKKFIYSLNNINRNIDYSEIGNKSYLKL